MSPAATPPNATALVARLTWLDFMRRKDFYVVAVFMLIYAVGAIAVRLIGVESADTARFLTSLGLHLGHLLAAFLAASFAARAFPEEFDRGTLAPLLAKPVSRGQVLAGKIGVCGAIAGGAWVLFCLITLVVVPGSPGQGAGSFLQVVTLQLASLAMLTTLAAALSLYWPTVVAALAALLWYVGAGFVVGLVRESLRGRAPEAIAAATGRILAATPDATLLSHIEVFAQGAAPMAWGLWAALMAYALLWSTVFWLWASRRFGGMRI